MNRIQRITCRRETMQCMNPSPISRWVTCFTMFVRRPPSHKLDTEQHQSIADEPARRNHDVGGLSNYTQEQNRWVTSLEIYIGHDRLSSEFCFNSSVSPDAPRASPTITDSHKTFFWRRRPYFTTTIFLVCTKFPDSDPDVDCALSR
jgi:hypothetical protein